MAGFVYSVFRIGTIPNGGTHTKCREQHVVLSSTVITAMQLNTYTDLDTLKIFAK